MGSPDKSDWRLGFAAAAAAMALKIVKGSIDRMFDKNLQDLVRGIRNHKEDEVRYYILLLIHTSPLS